MLAIKFTSSIQSNLDASIIHERILTKLEARGYKIISHSEDQISFKSWPVVIESRNEIFRRFDSGLFHLTNTSGGTFIKLRYGVSPVREIVFLSIFIFFISRAYGTPFRIYYPNIAIVSTVLFFSFILRIWFVAIAAEKLLEELKA